MAFDSLRGRTVLFGGVGVNTGGGGLLPAQTYEWDGTQWVGGPTVGPAGRENHAMAFDTARQRVVMCGGSNGTASWPDGTWEWDGVTWALMASGGPMPRAGHAIAYDVVRQRVVLFGGALPGGALMSDTWEWDGSTWLQASSVGPSARARHTMAFDEQRGLVAMFGGYEGPYANDAWVWDGALWRQQVLLAGPQSRASHAMAYDATRDRLVVHGGVYANYPGGPGQFLGDTWESTGPTIGASTIYGTTCGSPPLLLSATPGSTPRIGNTYTSIIDNAYLGIALVAWGHSNIFHQGLPLPLPLDAVGMNGCFLLQSAEELASGCTSTSWTTAEHSLPIPVDQQLLGLHVYLQAWTFAPGYNPLGLATSNGIELVIGDV